jgi:hypothetical protein
MDDTRTGWIQGFNGRFLVTGDDLILAAQLTNDDRSASPRPHTHCATGSWAPKNASGSPECRVTDQPVRTTTRSVRASRAARAGTSGNAERAARAESA